MAHYNTNNRTISNKDTPHTTVLSTSVTLTVASYTQLHLKGRLCGENAEMLARNKLSASMSGRTAHACGACSLLGIPKSFSHFQLKSWIAVSVSEWSETNKSAPFKLSQFSWLHYRQRIDKCVCVCASVGVLSHKWQLVLWPTSCLGHSFTLCFHIYIFHINLFVKWMYIEAATARAGSSCVCNEWPMCKP